MFRVLCGRRQRWVGPLVGELVRGNWPLKLGYAPILVLTVGASDACLTYVKPLPLRFQHRVFCCCGHNLQLTASEPYPSAAGDVCGCTGTDVKPSACDLDDLDPNFSIAEAGRVLCRCPLRLIKPITGALNRILGWASKTTRPLAASATASARCWLPPRAVAPLALEALLLRTPLLCTPLLCTPPLLPGPSPRSTPTRTRPIVGEIACLRLGHIVDKRCVKRGQKQAGDTEQPTKQAAWYEVDHRAAPPG